MIKIENLSFKYAKPYDNAVDCVKAEIGPGIHLLLGENGAGKTTLLRLIAGLLPPASGRCLVNGHDTSDRLPTVIRSVFFLSDDMYIPTKTIREFASVHSCYYPGFSEEVFDGNLADFGLTGHEHMASLSLGMRHKTLLAYVIALGVDVLLLDEPANGLDITSKKTLRAMLARNVGEEQTVVISTHTVSDLRELYDGLIMLSGGCMLLCSSSWDIAERIRCVATPVPPYEQIFMEQEGGMFLSILRNDSGEPGDVNYGLIYSALLSPRRDELLKILSKD